MVAQITDLPYLCVRNIFAYLSVADIIYIDRVIPEWTSIQRDYLGKLTHLTLLLGDDNPMQLIRSSRLNIPFEDELVEGNGCKPYRIIKITSDQIEIGHLKKLKLSQLMPSVEHLEVAVRGAYWSSINLSIVPLIKSWANQLITFKFRYDRCKDIDIKQICNRAKMNQSNNLHSLLKCINTRMVKLQCLHIDVFGSHFSLGDEDQIDLPILRQLQEFRFHSGESAEILFEQFHRYATDRLRTIAIPNYGSWEDMLTQFGESSLAKSFVLFSDNPVPHEFCASFFTAFDSLRSVKLRLTHDDETSFPQLARYLSLLPNLVHLDLNINTDISRFDPISDEHIHPLSAQIVTLCSGSGHLHYALRSRHWPRLFSACRILVITRVGHCDQFGCQDDGWDHGIYRFKDGFEELRECLLTPFKALPNVCKIYFSPFFSLSYENILTLYQL